MKLLSEYKTISFIGDLNYTINEFFDLTPPIHFGLGDINSYIVRNIRVTTNIMVRVTMNGSYVDIIKHLTKMSNDTFYIKQNESFFSKLKHMIGD